MACGLRPAEKECICQEGKINRSCPSPRRLSGPGRDRHPGKMGNNRSMRRCVGSSRRASGRLLLLQGLVGSVRRIDGRVPFVFPTRVPRSMMRPQGFGRGLVTGCLPSFGACCSRRAGGEGAWRKDAGQDSVKTGRRRNINDRTGACSRREKKGTEG